MRSWGVHTWVIFFKKGHNLQNMIAGGHTITHLCMNEGRRSILLSKISKYAFHAGVFNILYSSYIPTCRQCWLVSFTNFPHWKMRGKSISRSQGKYAESRIGMVYWSKWNIRRSLRYTQITIRGSFRLVPMGPRWVCVLNFQFSLGKNSDSKISH